MRFKLTLKLNKTMYGNIMPINYQYEQSAVIYHTIASASKEFASWLHENGYLLESGKRFKLFAYSPLKIEKRKVLYDSERIIVLSDTVEWQISFLPEKSTEKFIQGIFSRQTFEIGDRKSRVQFQVQGIEVLPSPDFTEEMIFTAMSPICVKYVREDGSVLYLSPDDERAKDLLLNSLKSKYEAYYRKPYAGDVYFDFEALTEPKRKLITIKADTSDETRTAGYLCQFRLKAPLELMKIAYESGIGSGNSQGFGCITEK